MSQISFYGQWHCGDCGATGVFEPIEQGEMPYAEHDCEAAE